MNLLTDLEKDLKELSLDLHNTEIRLDREQSRYINEPNAALLVLIVEIKYDREQLMAEIKVIRELIQDYKEEHGLDYEAEAYRRGLHRAANTKRSL